MLLPLETWLARLEAGELDRELAGRYGRDELAQQQGRLAGLLGRMRSDFGSGEALITSSPGRTELGGNHTDHNHGRVLTAATHLDCLAVVRPVPASLNRSAGKPLVTIHSEGFAPIKVDLSTTEPQPGEEGSAEAIVRGVAHGLKDHGVQPVGFDACVQSTIPVGSGLSSSAAFEVLVARVLNLLDQGAATTLDLARVARMAENVHFGKPCGFMDQIASAFMGVKAIDFLEPEQPAIISVCDSFEWTGHVLAVVDTGGSHVNLTPDYAAIPEEMLAACRVLGREYARGLELAEVMENVAAIRSSAGDRAVLRLIHFIEENDRAAAQAEALRGRDMEVFLALVAASGDSSWRLLQNCYSTSLPTEQGVPLALALSERLLAGRGACRIQGGGFAGTIQAWVPREAFADYRRAMDAVFGTGATTRLKVRQPDSGVFGSPNAGAGA